MKIHCKWIIFHDFQTNGENTAQIYIAYVSTFSFPFISQRMLGDEYMEEVNCWTAYKAAIV